MRIKGSLSGGRAILRILMSASHIPNAFSECAGNGFPGIEKLDATAATAFCQCPSISFFCEGGGGGMAARFLLPHNAGALEKTRPHLPLEPATLPRAYVDCRARLRPRKLWRAEVSSAKFRGTAPLCSAAAAAAKRGEYDVVIVGAGIIGLTVARQFLIGSDLSVAVVDARVPCSGATGAGKLSGRRCPLESYLASVLDLSTLRRDRFRAI